MLGGRGRGATPRFPLIVFFWANPPLNGITTLPQSLFGEKRLIKGQAPLQAVFSLSLMVPLLATEETEGHGKVYKRNRLLRYICCS